MPRELRPTPRHVHGPDVSLTSYVVVGFGRVGFVDAEILGRLTHLPVPIVERGRDGRIDGGAAERRECEHRAPAHGRFVTTRGENRIDAALVADRAEGGDGRLARQCVAVVGDDPRQRRNRGITRLVGGFHRLTERPGRGLHDRDVRILE